MKHVELPADTATEVTEALIDGLLVMNSLLMVTYGQDAYNERLREAITRGRPMRSADAAAPAATNKTTADGPVASSGKGYQVGDVIMIRDPATTNELTLVDRHKRVASVTIHREESGSIRLTFKKSPKAEPVEVYLGIANAKSFRKALAQKKDFTLKSQKNGVTFKMETVDGEGDSTFPAKAIMTLGVMSVDAEGAMDATVVHLRHHGTDQLDALFPPPAKGWKKA